MFCSNPELEDIVSTFREELGRHFDTTMKYETILDNKIKDNEKVTPHICSLFSPLFTSIGSEAYIDFTMMPRD